MRFEENKIEKQNTNTSPSYFLPLSFQFVNHINKFDLKIETGADFSERLSVFAANSDLIEIHNSGNSTYTLGHNEFSHLSFAEFEAKYLSTPAPRTEGTRMVNAFEGVKAADSVDWTTTDSVTAVKDQGSCGSCK